MHSANVASASGVIVDVGNFVRAETDTYFAKTVRDGDSASSCIVASRPASMPRPSCG